jgi:hypothetical protein
MKNNPSTNHIECGSCKERSACTADNRECGGCGSACGNSPTRGFSRRMFLKIALAAGGLTGCTPIIPWLTQPGSSDASNRAPQWKKVRDFTAPKSMKYAAFHDEDFGVLLLTENKTFNNSDIRFTIDGGQTLTAGRTQDDYCRFGLDIVDRSILWNSGRGTASGPAVGGQPPATGWKHAISLSTDGGRNWVNANPLDGDGLLHFTGASIRAVGWACHVSFLDARTGWVASSHPQLVVTFDGGANWVPVSLPDGLANIAAINCLDEKTGYLLDFQGNFYQTGDAGATWTSRALAYAEKQSMIPMSNAPLTVAAIRFTDPEHGLVAASLFGGGSSRMVIYSTDDGGRSWQNVSLPNVFGLPYLSRDGKFLTVVNFITANKLSLWAAS